MAKRRVMIANGARYVLRGVAATTMPLVAVILACICRPSDSFVRVSTGSVSTSRADLMHSSHHPRRAPMSARVHMRQEKLAELGRVGRHSCRILSMNTLSWTQNFDVGARKVSNAQDLSSDRGLDTCVRPARLAPKATTSPNDGKSSPLARGLQRVRRSLREVFRKVLPAAQAATVTYPRSTKGVEPPQGGNKSPPSVSVDIDGVLRQSSLLMSKENQGRVRRVAILMSDTGGGHRASAQALKAAFNDLYPDAIDVEIIDIWTNHAPWPLNKFVEAYQFMAKRPPIWRAFWEYGRFPLTRRLTTEMTNFQCHKRFRRMLEESNPDLVISVHPLCQDIPMRVLKKMGGGERKIPFVTVVTDLGGAHPTWFHREIDACFVPSDKIAVLARNSGLCSKQIRLHGLPIRPGFWVEQCAKTDLQHKLGLKPGVKTCLVVGGGDGVGGLKGIADSVGSQLAKEGGESQVVVVCGKNDEVKSYLEGGSWASNVHMHVKGFVSNMEEWMGAVDCIITKAGPGTIAEATVRGLPIMLSAFLPGQEAGNVPYVTEGGFGSFSRDPRTIAETVSLWLRDDELLAKMSNKAKEASRPKATYNICRDIGTMLFGSSARLANPPPKSLRLVV